MNYISSQSFHTLNHWQSGSGNETTPWFSDEYGFEISGLYRFADGVCLFPYAWYINADDTDEDNLVVYKQQTISKNQKKFPEFTKKSMKMGYRYLNNSDATKPFIHCIGIFGPYAEEVTPLSAPVKTKQRIDEVDLEWKSNDIPFEFLHYRRKRYESDGEPKYNNTITLHPGYTGSVIKCMLDTYYVVEHNYAIGDSIPEPFASFEEVTQDVTRQKIIEDNYKLFNRMPRNLKKYDVILPKSGIWENACPILGSVTGLYYNAGFGANYLVGIQLISDGLRLPRIAISTKSGDIFRYGYNDKIWEGDRSIMGHLCQGTDPVFWDDDLHYYEKGENIDPDYESITPMRTVREFKIQHNFKFFKEI